MSSISLQMCNLWHGGGLCALFNDMMWAGGDRGSLLIKRPKQSSVGVQLAWSVKRDGTSRLREWALVAMAWHCRHHCPTRPSPRFWVNPWWPDVYVTNEKNWWKVNNKSRPSFEPCLVTPSGVTTQVEYFRLQLPWWGILAIDHLDFHLSDLNIYLKPRFCVELFTICEVTQATILTHFQTLS